MMKTMHLIYALDKRIGGQSVGDRVSSVRRQLMKFSSRPLEDKEFIESRESFETRKTILHLLDRYDAQPQHDPIIAVPTWKEITHPKVAQRLYEGSYSVLIAEFAEDFDKQETHDDYIGRGPVMDHVSQNKARLKAYLDSSGYVETVRENETNSGRKQVADIFAEKMWIHIERVARNAKTTIQSEIATRLNDEGYRTAQGAEIVQSHVHRFIGRAGKRDEWESLKNDFQIPVKKKKGPDLLDILEEELNQEQQ